MKFHPFNFARNFAHVDLRPGLAVVVEKGADLADDRPLLPQVLRVLRVHVAVDLSLHALDQVADLVHPLVGDEPLAADLVEDELENVLTQAFRVLLPRSPRQIEMDIINCSARVLNGTPPGLELRRPEVPVKYLLGNSFGEEIGRVLLTLDFGKS